MDNFFAETEQVAFCTSNTIPGVDFSNDPLLQGRNFSYLDTQVKGLGGPNFSHIPINTPRCPFHSFQQDGHMAIVNPIGKVNYEPNSLSGADGGPRECPETGFRSFPAEESGWKVRERSESFADHYSQARQFYVSQTKVEQPSRRAKVERGLQALRNTQQDIGIGQVASGVAIIRVCRNSPHGRSPQWAEQVASL